MKNEPKIHKNKAVSETKSTVKINGSLNTVTVQSPEAKVCTDCQAKFTNWQVGRWLVELRDTEIVLLRQTIQEQTAIIEQYKERLNRFSK